MERSPLENLGFNRKNKMGWRGLDHLAQDRDRWRTAVNMLLKLLDAKSAANFLTACKLLLFEKHAYDTPLNLLRVG
jgi:hypothetical protein